VIYFDHQTNPREALFEGFEREEGPCKGKMTLFVVREPAVEKILKCIKDALDPHKQVYLGAGFLSPVSEEYVIKVVSGLSKLEGTPEPAITLETGNFALARSLEWMTNLPNFSMVLTLMLQGKATEGAEEIVKNLHLFPNCRVKIDIGERAMVIDRKVIAPPAAYKEYANDRILYTKELTIINKEQQ
jgi:hypothetical protein